MRELLERFGLVQGCWGKNQYLIEATFLKGNGGDAHSPL
jgi:hypothetical protein